MYIPHNCLIDHEGTTIKNYDDFDLSDTESRRLIHEAIEVAAAARVGDASAGLGTADASAGVEVLESLRNGLESLSTAADDGDAVSVVLACLMADLEREAAQAMDKDDLRVFRTEFTTLGKEQRRKVAVWPKELFGIVLQTISAHMH